jgi:glucose-1-phosphate cytidylyltransferase
MKVVILAGGFGTRIRDVSEDLPKPMIMIGDRPIIWHIMKYYASYGFDDFIICLGYKGEKIKDYFLNYKVNNSDITLGIGNFSDIVFHENSMKENWKITLADTGLDSMTGFRIKAIQKYIGDDDNFFLTYGDGLSDVPIDKLLNFHNNHKKILTLTGVRPPGRFGEIVCTEDGVISEFNEKPQSTSGRINGGFFVCRADLFNYIEDNPNEVFEKYPMKRLVESSELIQYNHDGFWQPMDTYREFLLLNEMYNNKTAPWTNWI